MDRIGRPGVLLPSLVGFTLAGTAIALAPSYTAVLALRVVQGTATAGIFITTVTLVGDTFAGAQRSAVLGANTAVLSVGAAAFPLVGGVLATSSWNAPFLMYLLGLPVALFAALALTEPSVEHASHGLDSFREAVRSLSLREAALVYGSAFMIELLLFGAVVTAIPFPLATEFAVGPVGIGVAVTAALVASAVAASQTGRLVTYVSDDVIIVLGFACAGVGLVAERFARRRAAPTERDARVEDRRKAPHTLACVDTPQYVVTHGDVLAVVLVDGPFHTPS